MSGTIFFAGGLITVAALSIFLCVPKPWQYFATPDGRKVAKGIVLALGVSLATLGAQKCAAGEWFTDADLYFGIDHTKKLSPQCESRGPNSHLTSNLGFRGTIYRTKDRTAWLGWQYTHHSCAFSPDRESYDAFGITLTKRLWAR